MGKLVKMCQSIRPVFPYVDVGRRGDPMSTRVKNLGTALKLLTVVPIILLCLRIVLCASEVGYTASEFG